MRLTGDLVLQSPVFINPLKDRELDLRGNKIPVIENLGVTQDQNDTIDLSDNEIKKLENFPLMNRLKTLLINNNRILRIASGLGACLPAMSTLILTNNSLRELSDIDPLGELPSLTTLSLLDNPVTKKQYYRAYVIHKLQKLRILDFKKVKQKERQEAEKFFGGTVGKKLKKEISSTKTFVPGEVEEDKLTPDQVKAIKDAIQNATTEEEIFRLEAALRDGRLPKDVLDSMNKHKDAMAIDANGSESHATS